MNSIKLNIERELEEILTHLNNAIEEVKNGK